MLLPPAPPHTLLAPAILSSMSRFRLKRWGTRPAIRGWRRCSRVSGSRSGRYLIVHGISETRYEDHPIRTSESALITFEKGRARVWRGEEEHAER